MLSSSAFCQGSNDKGILGTYQSGVPGLSKQTLTLSKDGTFVIDFWGEGSFTTSFLEGTWKKKGKLIYLTYLAKPKIVPESFQVREDSFSKKNQIKVFEEHWGVPGVMVNCISNGNKVTGYTDIDGNFYFPNIQLDSIIISSLGYEQINYKVNNSSSNFFEFKLLESRKYFTAYLDKDPNDQSDTLRIVKHKLISYKSTGDLKQKVNWGSYIKVNKDKSQK